MSGSYKISPHRMDSEITCRPKSESHFISLPAVSPSVFLSVKMGLILLSLGCQT